MSGELERTDARKRDGGRGFVSEHPLVVGFVVFEAILVVLGMGLGIVADKSPPGNTGLIHVAGLIGAFATLMGALAVLTAIGYAGYRLYRTSKRR